MATTLYFHAASSTLTGTLPTAEQSTLTSDQDGDAQTVNRTMDTTIGGGQTSIAQSSIAVATLKKYYYTKFVSPKLNQTSIAANTWTYDFAAAESNANANFPVSSSNQVVYVNAYVWRTSNGTKTGTILDGNTAATYSEGAANTETSQHGTFSGSAVSSINVNDDVIVCEIWFQVTQAMATSYTHTFYYDGTTENRATGNTVSNHASFIETPEALSFVTGAQDGIGWQDIGVMETV